MSALDSQIDDLYRRRPDEFTQARKELASGLKGEEARLVKQLKKPTAVPWAVNQVYWHARIDFDRLLKTGDALRKSQLAALRGRSADLKGAAAAHRDAVAAAVAKAAELAEVANLHPGRDVLARTFEALSLTSTLPEPLGRLTQPLQPGGFEMLTGVEPSKKSLTLVRLKPDATTGKADQEGSRGVRLPASAEGSGEASRSALGARRLQADRDRAKRPQSDQEGRRGVRLQADRDRAKRDAAERKRIDRERREAERAARVRERELAAASRRRSVAIKKAEAALARAQEREEQAERDWREAQQDVTRASQDLRKIRSDTVR